MITSYISLAISAIALFISLHNWRQSLGRIGAKISIIELKNDCWSVEAVVINKSSRTISLLDWYPVIGGLKPDLIEPRITKSGTYAFMKDGEMVGHSKTYPSPPIHVGAYETRLLDMVFSQNPTPKKSYIVIQTSGRKYKFKMKLPPKNKNHSIKNN